MDGAQIHPPWAGNAGRRLLLKVLLEAARKSPCGLQMRQPFRTKGLGCRKGSCIGVRAESGDSRDELVNRSELFPPV